MSKFFTSPVSMLAIAAAIALTGCQKAAAPLVVAPAPKEAAKVPVRPAVQPTITIRPQLEGEEAVPDEVIVRFKGDRREIPGMTFERALDIPGAYVYRVKKSGYAVQALDELDEAEDIAYVEPNYIYKAVGTVPNDPQYEGSWGVGAIKAHHVWPATRGTGVKVAVIDTGVYADHPDLEGRVLQGADIVNGDSDATDDHGHGTHVAGTIAAVADNGIGVAGVAPEALIIPIKVLGKDGTGTNEGIANGILKAAELGARVINMSLGGPDNSRTLADAIASVQAKGVIVIAAAGNDNVSTPFYPAANEGVIGVAAVDRTDTKASFSNFGAVVDIAAPGTSILSTSFNGTYISLHGTSMASPHVAGTAALLVAKYPSLKSGQLARLLQKSGRSASGFQMETQPRVVDAAAALDEAPNMDLVPPSKVTGLAAKPAAPGEVDLAWESAVDNTGVAGYKVFRNGAFVKDVKATTYTDVGLSDGEKASYTVVAYDADGNESAASAAVVGQGGTPSVLYTEIKVTKKTTSSLTITWKTETAVKSQLQWGTDGLVNSTPIETAAATEHTVTLSGLKRFKKYNFRAVGLDNGGHAHYSESKSGRTKLWFLF